MADLDTYITTIKTCETRLTVGYDEIDRSYVIIKEPVGDDPWSVSLTAQQCEMLETALRICRQSIRKT